MSESQEKNEMSFSVLEKAISDLKKHGDKFREEKLYLSLRDRCLVAEKSKQ